MKTLFTLLLLLSTSTLTFAANGDEKTATSQKEMAIEKMWKLLNRSIRVEENFRYVGFEARVEVEFKINDDGKIEVMEVYNASTELRLSIERQLQQLRVTDVFMLAGQTYIVPIKLSYQ